MKNIDNKIISAYVRGVFNQYRERVCNTEQFQEICAEHGVVYVDHTCCDGFCPECVQIINCEAYEEMKDEWDGFYM